MYCEQCGRILTADDRFCPVCGTPAGKSKPVINTDLSEEKTVGGYGVRSFDPSEEKTVGGYGVRSFDPSEEKTVGGYGRKSLGANDGVTDEGYYNETVRANEGVTDEGYDNSTVSANKGRSSGSGYGRVDNRGGFGSFDGASGSGYGRAENRGGYGSFDGASGSGYGRADNRGGYGSYNGASGSGYGRVDNRGGYGSYNGGADTGYGQISSSERSRDKGSGSRRGLGKLIVVLVAVILVLTAGLGLYLLVENSDWFKLAKAEAAILEGKYESGLNKISDINSDRADAVRGFTEVLKIRDEFKNSYSKDDIVDTGSDAYSYAKDFKEELTHFTEDYEPEELTEKLSDLYKDYSGAASDVAKLIYDTGVSDRFMTAQTCIKEYDSRKHGSQFTTDALNTIEKETETAYDYIREKLTETEEYKDFTDEFDGKAEDVMSDFMNSVNAQIEQDKYEIDKFGNKYSGKVIHYDETDSSHKAYVADGLDYADSEANIAKNAEKLAATLDCAMLLNSFKEN
ncbi:MAG: hypothetical protein UFA98_04000 [Ruminococcus sp.]|nr:hypothetical protein [Ruminococcus sp.]